MKENNYPKVSIIILNWNGLNDTIECLESLKKITCSKNGQEFVRNNISWGKYSKEIKNLFLQIPRYSKN